MKVGFYLRTNKAFRADMIFQTAFGGAEISAINLGAELEKLGWEVDIFANSIGTCSFGNFKVYSYQDVNNIDHDVFVCVRLDPVINPRTGFLHRKPKKIVLWSGDAYDQSNNQQLCDPAVRKVIDAMVCKSKWQMNTIAENFDYMDECNMTVKYNGVMKSYFEKKPAPIKNRFIHASMVFRGAEHLTRLWPQIKSEIKDAELHIFCKYSLYVGDGSPNEQRYFRIYDALKNMDGVIMHEPVHQREMALELSKSWLMLYPNHFLESSCGIALESQAAGCPVITSNLAGLRETIGNDGILINGLPGQGVYDKEFVRRTIELCQNKVKRNELSVSGRKKVLKNSTWDKIAIEWDAFLKSLLGS